MLTIIIYLFHHRIIQYASHNLLRAPTGTAAAYRKLRCACTHYAGKAGSFPQHFIIFASFADKNVNGDPVRWNRLRQWFQTLNLSFTFAFCTFKNNYVMTWVLWSVPWEIISATIVHRIVSRSTSIILFLLPCLLNLWCTVLALPQGARVDWLLLFVFAYEIIVLAKSIIRKMKETKNSLMNQHAMHQEMTSLDEIHASLSYLFHVKSLSMGRAYCK